MANGLRKSSKPRRTGINAVSGQPYPEYTVHVVLSILNISIILREGYSGNGYGRRSMGPSALNLVGLLGKFEPPGSPAFEYAMKLRREQQ